MPQPVAAPEPHPATPPGYSRIAPTVAGVLLVIYAARVIELAPEALSVVRPVLLVSVVGTVLALMTASHGAFKQAFESWILRIVVAYGAWAVIAAPLGLYARHSINQALPLFTPAILLTFVLALCAPMVATFDRVVRWFVFAVGYHSVIVLSNNVVAGLNRLTGTSSLDPNDLASLMALTFPLAIGVATRERRLYRILAIATAVLCVVVLLRTASRGGTLAFAIGAVVYVAGLRGPRRWRWAMLFVIAAPVAWIFAPPQFRVRMATMTSLETDYNLTEYGGRAQIRARAKEYFVERPVGGVGFANFETAEGMRMRERGRAGKWSAPHNAYWQALAELGLIGGLLFIGLLASAGLTAFRLWRGRLMTVTGVAVHRPEFLASLAGFAVGAYFLSHAYFWGMFGLVAICVLPQAMLRKGVVLPATPAVLRQRGVVPTRPVRLVRAR